MTSQPSEPAMTREEAIDYLKWRAELSTEPRNTEAYVMAIAALRKGMSNYPSEPMTQEEAIARLKSFSFGHLQEACEMAIAALRREGEFIEALDAVLGEVEHHSSFADLRNCHSCEKARLAIAKAKAQPPGA